LGRWTQAALYPVSHEQFVALAVVEQEQEGGGDGVGDDEEEDVEKVGLEVEGEGFEGARLLFDEVVVDEVAHEGRNQHVDQVQQNQLASHREVVGRLRGVHLCFILGNPDHPRHQ
jgi:hypothetical protein